MDLERLRRWVKLGKGEPTDFKVEPNAWEPILRQDLEDAIEEIERLRKILPLFTLEEIHVGEDNGQTEGR